jgi:hypothetical protein
MTTATPSARLSAAHCATMPVSVGTVELFEHAASKPQPPLLGDTFTSENRLMSSSREALCSPLS